MTYGERRDMGYGQLVRRPALTIVGSIVVTILRINL